MDEVLEFATVGGPVLTRPSSTPTSRLAMSTSSSRSAGPLGSTAASWSYCRVNATCVHGIHTSDMSAYCSSGASAHVPNETRAWGERDWEVQHKGSRRALPNRRQGQRCKGRPHTLHMLLHARVRANTHTLHMLLSNKHKDRHKTHKCTHLHPHPHPHTHARAPTPAPAAATPRPPRTCAPNSRACMHACTRMGTYPPSPPPPPHTHTRTHARTHTQTHTYLRQLQPRLGHRALCARQQGVRVEVLHIAQRAAYGRGGCLCSSWPRLPAARHVLLVPAHVIRMSATRQIKCVSWDDALI